MSKAEKEYKRLHPTKEEQKKRDETFWETLSRDASAKFIKPLRRKLYCGCCNEDIVGVYWTTDCDVILCQECVDRGVAQ